jgi:single-stranded-DNA-specific exonuclease
LNLENILKNRSIDISSLRSDKRQKLKWSKLDDVINLTMDKLMEVTRAGVVYDVDVDGVVSGKIVEEYIRKKGLMVYRFMNNRKKHGITPDVIDWVKREKIELLYVVDAGTNDIEAHQELSDLGIDVIVLDHHEQSRIHEVKNVHIVNCSVEDHLPKLSGAGVCYRYVEALDNELSGFGVTQYEPWVGLTVLSDHCSMLDPENRYYVDKLYENYDKIDLFKAFSFWGSKRNLFLFGVIPFLNACIRTNNGDWAMDAVMMGGVSKLKTYVKEKRAYVIDLQKTVISDMINESQIKRGKQVVLIRLSDEHFQWSGLTGLLANKIMGEMKKSVLVLYSEGDVFKGSFRGMGAVNHKVLEECGWKVIGHPQAAGVEILKSEALSVINKTLDLEVGEAVSEYDFDLEDRDVLRTFEDLKSIARFNEMASGDIPTIKFKLKKHREPFRNKYGKKIEYDFQSFKIRDFVLDRKASEDWIVEPLLDVNGIVLLRK